MRAGKQVIQVGPFWGDIEQAADGTSQVATLAPDEVKDGVDFKPRPLPVGWALPTGFPEMPVGSACSARAGTPVDVHDSSSRQIRLLMSTFTES